MKSLFIRSIVFACYLVAGYPAYAWPGRSTEEQLKEVCPTVLADRLKSPSSLRVVKWFPATSHAATKTEALGPEPTMEEFGSRYDEAMEMYTVLSALFAMGPSYMIEIVFEYESENGFGAMIAGLATCSYHTHDLSSSDDVEAIKVRIDGLTRTEWLGKQMSALRN